MLHILLKLGDQPYAIQARQVVRIVPMVRLRTLPHAPPYVAGLLKYRGKVIPVVDLCALAIGRPSSPRLSSRILLVDYPVLPAQNHLLGLTAEEVTETIDLNEKDLAPSGVMVANSPYLGKVAATAQGIVQVIEIGQLLPASLKESLFQPQAVGV